MAVELKDVELVAEELKSQFSEFQKKNDKRVDALESEKGELAGQVDTLNGKLDELDKIKSDLEKELVSLKRPGSNGVNKDVEAHKSAFTGFLRKGKEDGLLDLQQKALSIGVDADGGFAVPEELDRTLLELLRDESPMRALCNQITVSTSDYKKLVNLGGAGSGWVGETAARTATDTPTLAQLAATMGEIYANPQASQTSLDDMFFDVEKWLSDEVATEFAEKEGEAFLSGNGTNKPKGILAATMASTADSVRTFGQLQNVTSGTSGSFTADNLITLLYTLRSKYRNGAHWMLAGTTLHTIRTFKDGDGNYLWVPGLQAGQASSLLGYAVAENEDMPAVAADAHSVMFGNFKRAYTIVDRTGTRVLRDPYTNKPNVGFYTTKRVGGMLTDSNAVKVLTLSA